MFRTGYVLHRLDVGVLTTPCLGGFDRKTGKFPLDIKTQIELAFENCEFALKDAGGKGFEQVSHPAHPAFRARHLSEEDGEEGSSLTSLSLQVYRINSYHLPLNDEAMAVMADNFRKYMPNHRPICTCVGVTRLGADDMRVEIEVYAHDPEGGK